LKNKKIKQRYTETHLQEAVNYSQQQTEFITQLCHEIRNPLNGIYGSHEVITAELQTLIKLINAQQFMPSAFKEKLEQKIESINSALNDMQVCIEYQTEVLNSNLDLNIIMERKMLLERAPLNLKDIINEVVAMLRNEAVANGLTLNIKLPSEAIMAKGDALRLKQILINLVENAIKYTEQGKIDLVLTVENQTDTYIKCKLDVIDTGIGLSEEEVSGLFNRFTAISMGKQYMSSGLGLIITKSLLELMGGSITVASTKGKGSFFSVTLPLERLSQVELCQFKEHNKKKLSVLLAPIAAETLSSPTKSTILVAEDNEINQKVLKRILEKMNYEVIATNNGKEAVAKYQEFCGSIHAILMDMNMPILDGIIATQLIRDYERTNQLPRVPIIAVSGQVQENDKQEAFKAGIDDYIAKPYKKEKIYQTIERYKKFDPHPPLKKQEVSFSKILSSYSNLTLSGQMGTHSPAKLPPGDEPDRVKFGPQ